MASTQTEVVATRPESSSQITSKHLQALQRDGYVHIPSLLPPHLLMAAKATCKYLITKTREKPGSWPYVRTVPKQYPPWPLLTKENPDLNIWGIQHLLHPDMSVRDIFAEIYFCDEILGVVKELLGLDLKSSSDDDSLVMELFNLLISPEHKVDFELEWHRDDVKPTVAPDEEAAQLAEKSPHGRQLHAQYNLALMDDSSLIVVPGSHRRIRTDAERGADKYEGNMPGQVVVHMKPGDCVFYDSNILHRGVYKGIDAKTELGRMTLHGSVGLTGHGDERARAVLQHGIGDWVKDERSTLKVADQRRQKRAEGMRKRLIDMGSGRGDVGYSLEG